MALITKYRGYDINYSEEREKFRVDIDGTIASESYGVKAIKRYIDSLFKV